MKSEQRIIVALASVGSDKANYVIASSHKHLPSNVIVKVISLICKGGGGGRWDFAQGGTSHPELLKPIFSKGSYIIPMILVRVSDEMNKLECWEEEKGDKKCTNLVGNLICQI